MKKINIPAWNKKNKELIIAVVVSGFLAFLFLVNSPLHPWRGSEAYTDSSVFKTIALMMDKGYMPYKDSFDHKGPLLYAINYWGLKIAYYKGVWVFEFICMTITYFMLYKIARLKNQIISATLVAVTSMTLLCTYFQGGNLTEEYAMPFIAIGVYIFLDYLINNKISWYRIAISGISMGAVCLLRPNMIAVWIVFCIAIFLKKIIEKDWKQLGQFVLWFSLGVMIIVIPFVAWLAMNGALQACIEDYIIFNILYSSAAGGRADLGAQWNSFLTFGSSTVYVLAFVGIAWELRKKRLVDIIYAVYMVIGLVLLCMSGMTYGHYGMVLVPVVVYPISLIIRNIEKISAQDISSVIKMLVGVYLMVSLIVPQSLETIHAIPASYAKKDNEQFDDTTKQICELIAQLTSEDDAISVYGNWDIIYVKSQRRHATKYSYQFPIGQVMPEIMDEYMEQLKEELPSVIVVTRYDDNIRSFLADNSYEIIWPENNGEEEIDEFVYYRHKK